jgi:FkbH-like protein
MTSLAYPELSWLPNPPDDLNHRIKIVAQWHSGADGPRDIGGDVRALSGHALSINQLNRLASAIDRARRAGADFRPLTPFRLGVVSNATMELIVPALVATAPRHGISLEVITTPFNQVVQETLDSGSELYRAEPDAILLALDYRALRMQPAPGDPYSAKQLVDEAADYIHLIQGEIRKHSKAVSIVQTMVRPPETLFGSLDLQLPGTWRSLIDSLNRVLADTVRGPGSALFDVAGLAETVGLDVWHDPTQWAMAKLPFGQTLVPLYADHLCRMIAAIRGKSRRCLVLDLDNTLWGGVIGDDGLDGIVLGQGSAAGEAFLQVQKMALALRERGVVLAVSSKNDDAVARRPFREHPEMLLREEYIAVFRANWTDKATNIAAIAEMLSLGLESFVFLDDNPAERQLVRQKLPEVAVPELPSDPALYARALAAAGYFDAVSFSTEDRHRAQYYQDNVRRLTLQRATGDFSDYLASLQMVMTVAPFDEVSRPRIAQLINKSNQFNLTTRRYSELEVRDLVADPSIFTMQVRLADVFGDNGIVSVVICRKQERVWEIDTWLMSCRVLKRRVEEAVLCELARQARRAGARALIGRYRPTARNSLVKDHYRLLGFSEVASYPGGATDWRMELDHFEEQPLPITTARVGFDPVPAAVGMSAIAEVHRRRSATAAPPQIASTQSYR